MNQPEEKGAIDLYLHQETKIEKIQDSMTAFLKEQMSGNGKMDRLMDNQTHMQNRLDKSSETGFKSFEMLKGIVSDIGGMKKDTETHDKRISKMEGFIEKYLVGILVVAVTSIVTGIGSIAILLFKMKGSG